MDFKTLQPISTWCGPINKGSGCFECVEVCSQGNRKTFYVFDGDDDENGGSSGNTSTGGSVYWRYVSESGEYDKEAEGYMVQPDICQCAYKDIRFKKSITRSSSDNFQRTDYFYAAPIPTANRSFFNLGHFSHSYSSVQFYSPTFDVKSETKCSTSNRVAYKFIDQDEKLQEVDDRTPFSGTTSSECNSLAQGNRLVDCETSISNHNYWYSHPSWEGSYIECDSNEPGDFDCLGFSYWGSSKTFLKLNDEEPYPGSFSGYEQTTAYSSDYSGTLSEPILKNLVQGAEESASSSPDFSTTVSIILYGCGTPGTSRSLTFVFIKSCFEYKCEGSDRDLNNPECPEFSIATVTLRYGENGKAPEQTIDFPSAPINCSVGIYCVYENKNGFSPSPSNEGDFEEGQFSAGILEPHQGDDPPPMPPASEPTEEDEAEQQFLDSGSSGESDYDEFKCNWEEEEEDNEENEQLTEEEKDKKMFPLFNCSLNRGYHVFGWRWYNRTNIRHSDLDTLQTRPLVVRRKDSDSYTQMLYRLSVSDSYFPGQTYKIKFSKITRNLGYQIADSISRKGSTETVRTQKVELLDEVFDPFDSHGSLSFEDPSWNKFPFLASTRLDLLTRLDSAFEREPEEDEISEEEVEPIKLVITRQPRISGQGERFRVQPIIEIRNQSNEPTSFEFDVTIEISKGSGGSISGFTTVSSINGVCNFTNLSFEGTVGEQYKFKFTSQDSEPVESILQVIQPSDGDEEDDDDGDELPTEYSLSVLVEPVFGKSGEPFETQPKILISPPPAEEIEIEVSIFSGLGGTLLGTKVITSSFEEVGFSDLSILGSTTQGYVLIFNGKSLSNPDLKVKPVKSGPFFIEDEKILFITRQYEFGRSEEPFITQPVLEIRYKNSRVSDSDEQITVSIFSGESGELAGTQTVTAVNGLVEFTDLSISGETDVFYTLKFESNDSEVPSVNGAERKIKETEEEPGDEERKLVIDRQPMFRESGKLFVTQPVISIRTGDNKIIDTSALVTAEVYNEEGELLGTTTIPASNGIARFTDLAIVGEPEINYVLLFTSDAESDWGDFPPASVKSSGNELNKQNGIFLAGRTSRTRFYLAVPVITGIFTFTVTKNTYRYSEELGETVLISSVEAELETSGTLDEFGLNSTQIIDIKTEERNDLVYIVLGSLVGPFSISYPVRGILFSKHRRGSLGYVQFDYEDNEQEPRYFKSVMYTQTASIMSELPEPPPDDDDGGDEGGDEGEEGGEDDVVGVQCPYPLCGRDFEDGDNDISDPENPKQNGMPLMRFEQTQKWKASFGINSFRLIEASGSGGGETWTNEISSLDSPRFFRYERDFFISSTLNQDRIFSVDEERTPNSVTFNRSETVERAIFAKFGRIVVTTNPVFGGKIIDVSEFSSTSSPIERDGETLQVGKPVILEAAEGTSIQIAAWQIIPDSGESEEDGGGEEEGGGETSGQSTL